MSKRSNRGKGYFYAHGQSDGRICRFYSDINAFSSLRMRQGSYWPTWAQVAYQNGFNNG